MDIPAGVEDEVAVGGRVDDHDDLVEVAAVVGEKNELLLLLLLRLLLGGGRGRRGLAVGGAAEPRGSRSPAREWREARGGARSLGLGLAVVEVAGRGEG